MSKDTVGVSNAIRDAEAKMARASFTREEMATIQEKLGIGYTVTYDLVSLLDWTRATRPTTYAEMQATRVLAALKDLAGVETLNNPGDEEAVE